jgi:hypothetical protein
VDPFHAIQLTNGQFVVIRSKSTGTFYSDHDVVEVDAEGRVIVSYKDTLQSTTKQKFLNHVI